MEYRRLLFDTKEIWKICMSELERMLAISESLIENLKNQR